MSESQAHYKHKITGATDLQSVVRTMKAVAASNIGQYEKSVIALADYSRTIEMGLGACFRQIGTIPFGSLPQEKRVEGDFGAIVFGSDQGLVGQFNDQIADFTIATLSALTEKSQIKPRVWAMGERVYSRLADSHLILEAQFEVPRSVITIPGLLSKILSALENGKDQPKITELYLFYHHPTTAAGYVPISQHLLPLGQDWQKSIAQIAWPTPVIPEIRDQIKITMAAFIKEYLFISLFKACAESLASENASRLEAMQRADKNIDEMLINLNTTFHRLRQDEIDEELFDVISGFEALKKK